MKGKFFHANQIGKRPFNFPLFEKWAEEEDWNFDLKKPEKYVFVGDMLTCDVMFGNLNNMSTVWVTGEYPWTLKKL